MRNFKILQNKVEGKLFFTEKHSLERVRFYFDFF